MEEIYLPIGKRLLAQVIENKKQNVSKGGIILTTEPEKESVALARVVVVSQDWDVFKPGDIVQYTIFKIDKFKWNGDDYIILGEGDIVAKILTNIE